MINSLSKNSLSEAFAKAGYQQLENQNQLSHAAIRATRDVTFCCGITAIYMRLWFVRRLSQNLSVR